MANGRSLHIGLNTVDPKHYQGWDGKLAACEFDARDMHALAAARGFQASLLLTQQATVAAVGAAIGAAAEALQPGDLFFLTYSGHGGQVPDSNGDEPDRQDETWVLYDRQLVDDELYVLWSRFRPGVRIVVLSDSCHSGSAVRADLIAAAALLPVARESETMTTPRFRGMPDRLKPTVYRHNKEVYDAIQRDNPAGERAQVGASILLISGCQDNQLSSDGDRNGLFSATLLQVWNQGRFKGSYRQFHRQIVRKMPPWQSPNYFITGAPNPAFERQAPFAI